MEGGCPKGRGLAEGERELSQPPALRATSFQRKEGEVVKNLSPTFQKREKRDENPSTPFPWKGDARRAGGLAEVECEVVN